MSADATFDPYEIRTALRKLGVQPVDDPACWTEQVMANWPEQAQRAVKKVLADPAKLLASQLFVLDEKLISEDLSDLAALATEPVDVRPDEDRWATDRGSVLCAIGAVLYDAARQEAGLEHVPMPEPSADAGPDGPKWIGLMIRPVAQTAGEVLPLFLNDAPPPTR